jgi:2-polyprenyl-3-methyl-5-hydroxy-6-metoxy-1,4-benzoquinol methylase
MDEKKMKRAIQGLQWEARYVKRAKGEDPKDYFMAEIDILDENLSTVLQNGSVQGETLLDIGTGVGWQAIRLAELGFKVTATDVSSLSLAQAVRNAEKSGMVVEFLRDNVLHTSLTRKFDIVVDRGCFAGQSEPYFRDFVENVFKLTSLDGHYFLTLPRGKIEPKLVLLAEKFTTVQTIKSFYLGPKGEIWKTFFIHLRPIGNVVSGNAPADQGPVSPPSSGAGSSYRVSDGLEADA